MKIVSFCFGHQVKLVNNLRVVDEETFQANFAGQLTYVTALSGDSLVELVETGVTVEVNFDERIEYCKLVETTRMSESKKQVLRKTLARNDLLICFLYCYLACLC